MSDYRHRLTDVREGSSRTFSYEDGKTYRGYHLDTDAAKAHVKYKEDQSQYYKKDWRYVGSVPMELLVKYQSQLPPDESVSFWSDFATDKDVKTKFLTWLKANYPELLPGHSSSNRGRS